MKISYFNVLGLFFMSIGFLSIGCQSSPLKDFSELKVGMEKGEVLDILGNPNHSGRFHGKDRWTYVFYDNKIRYKKEVHFDQGHVVYLGDTWTPPENANAQFIDEKNESEEKKIIQKEEEVSKKNKETQFSDYESKVKGETKILPMPNYVPIE